MKLPELAEAITRALRELEDVTLGETVTSKDIPYIRIDVERARREFSEDEYDGATHNRRLAALDTLAELLKA